MADSLADAARMVAAAKAKPGILSVFQQRRYNRDFVKVQEVIESGVLGRIVQIRMTENRFGRRWDWQTLQRLWRWVLKQHRSPLPGSGTPTVRSCRT